MSGCGGSPGSGSGSPGGRSSRPVSGFGGEMLSGAGRRLLASGLSGGLVVVVRSGFPRSSSLPAVVGAAMTQNRQEFKNGFPLYLRTTLVLEDTSNSAHFRQTFATTTKPSSLKPRRRPLRHLLLHLDLFQNSRPRCRQAGPRSD